MTQENIANVDSSAANDATVKAQTNAVAMPTFTNAEAPRDGQAYLATAQTALQPQTVTDNPRSPTARQVPTNNAAQPLSSVRPVDLRPSPQSQSQAPTAEPTLRPLKPTPLPPSHASTSIANLH
ncbi:hypothetical protein N7G274_003074 [Stereocaulon virgatum]|uniref:Uncharacterized protein n=1 Tax=Stereocaulon virgatum TaxID=373712 RepID=A0ABR4AEW8_9LECA